VSEGDEITSDLKGLAAGLTELIEKYNMDGGVNKSQTRAGKAQNGDGPDRG